MITAEIQSAPEHHDDDGDRDDHGQEQLGQIAGEVAVEGVDPAGGQHDQAARSARGRCRPGPGGRSARPGRCAGPTWPTPRPGRPSAPRASPPRPDRRSPPASRPTRCGPGPAPGGGPRHRDGVGDEPGLGHHQAGGDATQTDGAPPGSGGFHACSAAAAGPPLREPAGAPVGRVDCGAGDGDGDGESTSIRRGSCPTVTTGAAPLRCSPTRMALAMAVRAGFTAPMLGKKLVSTT